MFHRRSLYSFLIEEYAKGQSWICFVTYSILKNEWIAVLLILPGAWFLLAQKHIRSGGRLNKKDGLTRYGNSHVKDKTS